MRLQRVGSEGIAVALVASVCVLAACAFLSGCQKGEAESADEGTALLREMKTWFEATDYEAYGYSSLEEALDDIYQDDGYTSMLYRDIGAALDKAEPGGANARAVFRESQEWFELIDYEMSGYDSLEEAIEDIFEDGGETLDMYERLAEYNAGAN